MPKQTFFNLPEEKRKLIEDIAIDEFAEKNYKSVSISGIVARAGIAKGSFYQYFEDKRDLYMYLMELAGREKMIFLQNHEPPSPDMDIFAYMRWLVVNGVKFQFAHPRMAQLGVKALYSDAQFKDEIIGQLKQASQEYYLGLVQQGKQQGAIASHINDQVAVFVLSSVFNELGNYLVEEAGQEVEDLKDLSFFDQNEMVEKTFNDVVDILQFGFSQKEKTNDQC